MSNHDLAPRASPHADIEACGSTQLRVAIVTSIHRDFDARIWRHAMSIADCCDVHLICPWNVAAGKDASGIHFHPFVAVDKRWKRPYLVPLRVGRQLIPLLPIVDLIHFHDIDLLPWMAFVGLRKPVIYDVHENYPDEMLVRPWIPQMLRRPLFHAVRASQYVLARFVKNVVFVVPSQEADFPTHRLRTFHLPNFASHELLRDVESDYSSREDVVVFTGSHYESNGSLLLVEIAERVRNARPSVRFLMTDRFENLQFKRKVLEAIRSRGLESTIMITSQVRPPEIMHLLNGATIGLVPSLRVEKQVKAMPTKLFEYMAAGLPTVASDLPLITEIVEAHQTGLLARPEDPQSFADAIVRLVDDRKEAAFLGANGQHAFRTKFSWESNCRRLLDFYSTCLSSA